MGSQLAELKKKMKRIKTELESFTGLKLKKIPNVNLKEQSLPFYYGEKNLIIWGIKDPLNRPTSERKLVEELAHAILHQNQKEWLPSGLHECFAKYSAIMLKPVKEDDIKEADIAHVLKGEIADIQKFIN